jgi:ubiquinone/menaquinone biosynthesis C-methylase UbiE
MALKALKATEQVPFSKILQELPIRRRWAKGVLSRLRSVMDMPQHPKILEVGAAAGGNLVAFTELGCSCVGIDPWDEARANAIRLSHHLGIPINIVAGTAESIPYSSNSFDIVCAFAVMEHVQDLDEAVREIYRVLKSGGVFWFSSASAMSPFQNEIRGFPLFGWYPDSLKSRIMLWAKENKPHLVGYTKTPAIHWFTPRKARTLLQKHGFSQIFDRWDVRKDEGCSLASKMAIRTIRRERFIKTIADMLVPGCSYSAVKSRTVIGR